MDYAFMVCGLAYIGMLMATMKLGVKLFFMNSIISVITLFISQNFLSRISDKMQSRIPFMVGSKILYSASMFILACFRSFLMVVLSSILINMISGEMLSAAIVYELIDLKQREIPPSLSGRYNKSREFAKYRIFGSMGWAFTAPAAGYGISILNAMKPFLGYTIMFSISGIGTLGSTVFLYYILRGYSRQASSMAFNEKLANSTVLNVELTSTGVASARGDDGKESSNDISGIAGESSMQFYKKPTFLMLVTSTFISAIAFALQSNAFSPFIKNSLGASEFFYGLLAFTWAISEIPLFFLSSYLVKRHGWKLLILLGFLFQEIKAITYGLIYSTAFLWVIVVIQILNSFGITYPARSYAITNEIAPNRKALAMTLNQTLNSVGSFIGGIIGMLVAYNLGPVADTMLGYRVIFNISATITLIAILTFISFQAIVYLKSGKN